jgi:hypothetical protein
MAIRGFRPSVLEIVDQRLGHHPGQWVSRRVSRFPFRNPKPLVLPVDVVEGKLCDFMAPESIGLKSRKME